MSDSELVVLIRFWEGKLGHKGLFSPSVQYFIERTIKELKKAEELESGNRG